MSRHGVELADGCFLDVSDPDHTMLSLTNIAQPLSREPRFNTSAHHQYSVAEHAVLVASKLRRMSAPLSLQFAGLHHDDAEFLLKDIPAPIKPLFGEAYTTLTEVLDRTIHRALGWPNASLPPFWHLDDIHDPLVEAVDSWEAELEATVLTTSGKCNAKEVSGAVPIVTEAEDVIRFLPPEAALEAFMGFHALLVGEHRSVFGDG